MRIKLLSLSLTHTFDESLVHLLFHLTSYVDFVTTSFISLSKVPLVLKEDIFYIYIYASNKRKFSSFFLVYFQFIIFIIITFGIIMIFFFNVIIVLNMGAIISLASYINFFLYLFWILFFFIISSSSSLAMSFTTIMIT